MDVIELTVVGIVLSIVSIFGVIMLKRMGSNKVAIKQARNDYEDNKDKYRVMTSTLFDSIVDEELTHAVLFNLLTKEDSIYEGDVIDKTMIDVLNKEQIIMYTAYMVERSVEGGRGSIHSFFIEDNFKIFVPYIEETFNALGCYEISKLLLSAKQFAQGIEDDLDDIIIEGDYGNYNFADYTSQFLSMVKSSALITNAVKYIRENKTSFLDVEEK